LPESSPRAWEQHCAITEMISTALLLDPGCQSALSGGVLSGMEEISHRFKTEIR